jgi:hypothetical protein
VAKPVDRIEELMKTWEPKIRDAVLVAIRTIRDRVVLSDLVALLRRGDVEGAIRYVGLEPAAFRPVGSVLEQGYEAGGVDATLQIKPRMGPLGVRIAAVFDVKAPGAEAFLRNYTANLITQISDETRAAVRQVLAPLQSGQDPMLTGNTPEKLALDLVGRINRATGHREGGILGLTREQAAWGANYEAELTGVPKASALTRKLRDQRFDPAVRRAIAADQPIPAKTRQAMIAAYRNRTLRMRANTIAVNEASTIMHSSQVEAWDQAIRRGAATESQVRRFWITAGDDRVRPSHAAVPGMNPEGVGLHAAFNTPKGPTMQPGWAFDPGCRCRVRVRVVEEPPAPSPIPLRTPALVPA